MIQKLEGTLRSAEDREEMAMADGADDQTAGEKGDLLVAEETAKDRAATVVLGYREVDWEGVVAGEHDAVARLVTACDQHEATRMYLESLSEQGPASELASLAERLAKGLETFYGKHVAPRLRHQKVIRQMLAVAEPPSMAGGNTDAATDPERAPRRRPPVTVGHTMRVNTGCGNLYVTVNEDETGRPFELFNHMGKAGGCAASQNEAIGRLISYSLRCGASIEPLIKQLKGISCHRPAWGEDGKISSCADGIGKALERYYVALQGRVQAAEDGPAVDGPAVDGPAADVTDGSADTRGAGTDAVAGRGDVPAAVGGSHGTASAAMLSAERRDLSAALEASAPALPPSGGASESRVVQGACRDCGSQLAYEEGCVKCYSCGFTECG